MALKGTPKFAADSCCSSLSPSAFSKQPPLTTLEVTVLSAEEVVIGGTPRRRALDKGAYALVHTDKEAVRTRVNDEDYGNCNGYPYWGEAVRVAVSNRATAIDVEIYRTRSDGRVESMASARVPVADFSSCPPGYLHCLSYRLFDSGSRMKTRNGIVNIRVKRLSGAAPTPPSDLGKGGKVVDDAASGSGDSCCGAPAKEGKVASAAAAAAAAAAPAGAVMGYPVGLNAAGQANGKGST